LAVDNQPGADVILADRNRSEIVRLEGETGKLVWRSPIGGPFDAAPVLVGKNVLLAARSGGLHIIDVASGKSPGQVQMPQELRVAPTYSRDQGLLYQVTDHTNLFVLDADYRCTQAVYLGHEPGTITVPPVMISPYLLIAENNGFDASRLRVFAIQNDEGKPDVSHVQDIPLRGRVDVSPLASGVRVVVTTDVGDIRVFEVSAADAKRPLVEVAVGKAAGEEEGLAKTTSATGSLHVAYPLLRSERLWIADTQLTYYDVLASKNRLQPRGVENEGTVALQPPLLVGDAIIHVRRDLRLPGVVVSAERLDGGDPFWETRLAAPLARAPLVDSSSGRVIAVTTSGSVYRFDKPPADQVAIDEPLLLLGPADLGQPVAKVEELPGGLLLLASAGGEKQLAIADLSGDKATLRRLELPDPLAAVPSAVAGGILAPCAAGQAFLLDVRSGAKMAEPFQPPLRQGAKVRWSSAVGLNEQEFLIADGSSGLYRVGIKGDPARHLAALAFAEAPEAIVSTPAATDSTAFAVTRSGVLVSFALPGLEPKEKWPLGAQCDWGPARVGDRVLLTTDDGTLRCLAGDKPLWQVPLAYGPLAGPPLIAGDQYLLASRRGVIWRVAAADGREVAKVETGVPLATGPVVIGDRLLVGGHDGTLHWVPQP
jgi:outer membrane protein assembly factor BamB